MTARRLIACMLAAVVTAPAGASATLAPGAIALALLDPAARARLHDTRARIEALRIAFTEGLASGAAAALDRQLPVTGPAEPADAVTRLSDAIARASRRVHVADRNRERLTPNLLAAMVRPDEPQRMPPAIRRAVAAAPPAGLELLTLIERTLPALQRLPIEPIAATTTGCDLVDQLPYLCVSSDANHVHTRDAALLIDLGGNDTYRNTAGGAPATDDGTTIQVTVVIDLAGDDRYEAPPGDEISVAQGAGFLGGIGILVDAAGDDAYLARAGSTDAGGYAVAQGGGYAGFGALADLAGDDEYLVAGSDAPGVLQVAFAQGAGAFCGADATQPGRAACPAGFLVDRGLGSDTYGVDLGTAQQAGQRFIAAQGYANLAVGLLADEGGSDSMRMSAGGSLPGLDRYPLAGAACPGNASISVVCVNGQGSALGGGLGMILGGSGDTSYEVDVANVGMVWSLVRVQGYGGLHGVGIIDDPHGNDRYRSSVNTVLERTISVDDDCVTALRAPCTSVAAEISGTPSPGNDLFAQGVGMLASGTGALFDESGDDRYELRNTASITVHLDDRMTAPTAPASLTVTGYASPSARGQGMSDGPAFGFLVDGDGTDAYDTRVDNSVHASAASLETDPQVRARTTRPEHVFVQGASGGAGAAGVLLDLGGVGDVARVEVSAPASASPAGDARTASFDWPWVQGSWGGVFVLLGERPLATSSPSMPICEVSQGARGFGRWMSCAKSSDDPEHQLIGTLPTLLHHNGGFVPRAVGIRPSLEVISPADAAVRDGSWIDVAARVAGAGSFAGSTIHLSFQGGCTVLCNAATAAAGTVWRNIWEADAVVGPDGVARARLPIEPDRKLPNALWRIYATYDGAEGLLPAHAERRLSLT